MKVNKYEKELFKNLGIDYTKLNVAIYSLDKWREMIVFFNGKQRLLDK